MLFELNLQLYSTWLYFNAWQVVWVNKSKNAFKPSTKSTDDNIKSYRSARDRLAKKNRTGLGPEVAWRGC